MGGGSKSSTSSTYTTNNNDSDATVSGGGVAVAQGGSYVTQDLKDSLGVQAEGSTIGDVIGTGMKAGGDVLQDGSIKIGASNVINLTAMDNNTQSVLDQALTVMAANANNMMTLAAGRDPNKPLADDSVEITAKTDAVKTSLSGLAEILTPARVVSLCAVLVLIVWMFLPRKKRKAE